MYNSQSTYTIVVCRATMLLVTPSRLQNLHLELFNGQLFTEVNLEKMAIKRLVNAYEIKAGIVY